MNRAKTVSPHCRLLFWVFAAFLWTGKVLALNATDTIQAASFSGQSGITTETCSEGGQDVTSILNGNYIYFDSVAFGSSGIQCFEARIASNGTCGYIEVLLDSLTGQLVGTCDAGPVTGGWQTWTSRACRVAGASGVHTVYLKFTGPQVNRTGVMFSVHWFTFHGTPSYTTTGWRSSSKSASGVIAEGIWNGTINLSAASGQTPTIVIYPDTQYQRVEGFGGAFNDIGACCIDTLHAAAATVMKELFDPVNGCKFNVGRVPIGISDFSVDSISLDTAKNDTLMTRFSIAHDLKCNIPFIKAAMQYQPNLMIYGSPWTPPSWMKNTNSWQGSVNGTTSTMTQTPTMLTAYALYFQKFVQAWDSAGISIFVVYPQNEPEYQTGDHPSCSWGSTYGTALKNFCSNYVCPLFNKNNIGAQVWMGTSYEDDFSAFVEPSLTDTAARHLIMGCGLQRGGAQQLNQAMDTAAKYNLPWHAMETENWCYSGANCWNDAMNTYMTLIQFEVNGTNSFNFWNIILSNNYSFVPWMTRAQNSMITVNTTSTPHTVTYNPEFYMMKHFSYYVAPGAVLIKTTCANSNLTSCAFKNPDGTIVLEVQNYARSSPISAVIQVGSQAFTASLPDSSANTFFIGGTEPHENWTPGVTAVQYVPEKKVFSCAPEFAGVYDIKGRLIKVLNTKALNANAGGLVWDRTDASGRKAAPGVYILISRVGKNVNVMKVLCK